MKNAHWLLLIALASCLLPSCFRKSPPIVTTGSGPGIGPFDSRGYYREEWADDPTKWRRPTTTLANNTTSPSPPERPTTPSSTPRISTSSSSSGSSSSSATSSAPKPRPPQPTATRYTVKRGDTLIAIAKRHRSTVSAIQSANGISGSMIHPGQRLVIPRR